MAVRPIPEGSVEIQIGLWAYLRIFTVGGVTHSRYLLYSAEGYCFWNDMTPENYDEEGNLLPMEQRLFAQYASTSFSTIEELNQHFFSVPVQDGYEIVSVGGNDHAVA